jgi:hypothetical protein
VVILGQPISLCLNVPDESRLCCVLAEPLQSTWRWLVKVDEVLETGDRDGYAQEVVEEPQQILPRFEMGFRKDCSQVDRALDLQKEDPLILPQKAGVSAAFGQGCEPDPGLDWKNLWL